MFGAGAVQIIWKKQQLNTKSSTEAELVGANEVLNDLSARWLPQLKAKYPELGYSFEGEVKNAGTTQHQAVEQSWNFSKFVRNKVYLSIQLKNG